MDQQILFFSLKYEEKVRKISMKAVSQINHKGQSVKRITLSPCSAP